MRLQTGATSILENTSRLLRAGKKGRNNLAAINEPSWYKVVAANPPTHNLALRPHNLEKFLDEEPSYKQIGHLRKKEGVNTVYRTRNRQLFNSKAQHLYRPKQIRYFEDKIRSLFYNQHPWELARPKLLIENDGDDAARQDWRHMDQFSKKLDGESVVRRTMYLIENDDRYTKSNWIQAYDQARLEFYRLRMREESEIQVASEEAVMFGSSFGQSYIEHGIEQEQKVIDKWVLDATKASAEKKARMVNTMGSGAEEEGEEEAASS